MPAGPCASAPSQLYFLVCEMGEEPSSPAGTSLSCVSLHQGLEGCRVEEATGSGHAGLAKAQRLPGTHLPCVLNAVILPSREPAWVGLRPPGCRGPGLWAWGPQAAAMEPHQRYMLSTEKPLRTKRKRPPPAERGDPGAPLREEQASAEQPAAVLRYKGGAPRSPRAPC